MNIEGEDEVETSESPAGQNQVVLDYQGVHGEESHQLEPGNGVGVVMREEGGGEGGQEDGLLVDLEREEEEDQG